MNWVKIKRSDNIPIEDFLVTDGNGIALKHHMSPNKVFLGDQSVTIETATHYILLSDIPLPEEKTDNNSEDFCDCPNSIVPECSRYCNSRKGNT